ncbi:hypothetical protein [Pseudoflavonifractor phocaeensis]|uniref:hypothetical protein n=1 Tax=Pseudoflavonifractor phocaeensis TaxID=1870988 RepID=UPI0019593596|nr:hypothetical protein [Pseudoflavonifractor phocaeensis]MBM6722589.1 hypothetical protein [Pseudoflavonifractor phocaeensis]
MAQSVGRLSKRLVMLFMVLVVLMGAVLPGAVVTPAQAGILPIERAYIQTTVDTSSWDILAGVVNYTAGTGGHQIESQRVGKGTLDALAKSETPSDSGLDNLIDVGLGQVGGDTTQNLVLCFPGSMSFSGWNDSSTAEDTARAQLIRNSMIYDLNAAFKFVYGDEYGTYTPQVTNGNDTPDERLKKYAEDMDNFLSHIPGTPGESFGVNGAIIAKTDDVTYPKNPVDSEIAEANYGKDYYVSITRDGETRTFLYRMLKGYGVEGTGLPEPTGDSTKYIHWGTLAVEAFVNYSSDESLQVTADNVYDSEPGAIEGAVAKLFGGFVEWLANTLGLWSFDELIFNGGVRGTNTYIGGVFPRTWEPTIWTFFFFAEVAAVIMLLYAIIYNVGRKAMATIDPVARASAIEQIKYLFIVAFLLAVIPIVLPLLISVSYELTGVFHDALGGATAEQRFRKLASTSGGLGAVLSYLLYLGAVIYFNVFYVFRALAIALLIILGPIFVAMMALSESKRQLAMAWFKEFCANLFIQPLQALMLSFILLVPDTGRNIDSIVMAYIMIPLTNLLRQMFFGSSGGLADRVGQQGKQAGTNVARTLGRGAAGFALGAVGGGIAGGDAALKAGKGELAEAKNGGKEGGGTGAPKTKDGAAGAAGGSSGSASGGGSADSGGEKKADGKDAKKEKAGGGANGEPVSAGAAGGKTPLSEKTAENLGEPGGGDKDDDKDKDGGSGGAADKADGGGDGGSSGGGAAKDPNHIGLGGRIARLAGGAALGVAVGAGLGGLTGGLNGLMGRKYFEGPGGKGIVNQLSQAAAKKGGHLAAEGISGQRLGSSAIKPETPLTTEKERQEQYYDRKGNYANEGNAFTSAQNKGDVLKTSNTDGASTYSFRDKKAQANAGIDNVGKAGKGAYTATYNKDQLADNDLSNFEQLQQIMQNGTVEEKEALAAAGITGFEPITGFNPETGQEEMIGASVTYDAKKAQENFGLGRGENGTLTSTVNGSEAPSFVPDANSYLNSNKAAVNYGASMLNKDGFDTKVDSASGMVTATADAKTFQTTNMPENLMQYAQAAKVGKDGTMTMQIPQEEMVKAFGGVPTGSNTQVGRSVAADMAAEGTFVPPTQGSTTAPRTMSTAASSGIESLKAQNLNVTPAADGSGYTISGTAQAAGSAYVPSGIASKLQNATTDDQGNVSVFVPTQDFSASYAATQTGQAAGAVPMATIGTHNAATQLHDQGVVLQIDPSNNGTVNLVAQKGADLSGVNATPEVAQAVAQLNQQMQSGGGNVLNVPASTFSGYTGGAPAAENLVSAGSYMPAPAPQPAAPPPTAASPIQTAPPPVEQPPMAASPVQTAPPPAPEFPLTPAEAAAEARQAAYMTPPPTQTPVPDFPLTPAEEAAEVQIRKSKEQPKDPPRGHGNLDNRNFNNKN